MIRTELVREFKQGRLYEYSRMKPMVEGALTRAKVEDKAERWRIRRLARDLRRKIKVSLKTRRVPTKGIRPKPRVL